jgi:hypothetical protein
MDMKGVLLGTIGTALKRLPTMAAARRALAEDLRRLHRANPELARQLMKRMRNEEDRAHRRPLIEAA